MPKLSYDNVTMLDDKTRQCDIVMSAGGPDEMNGEHIGKMSPNGS